MIKNNQKKLLPASKAIISSYHCSPSLLTCLPWVEFDDRSQYILLQDKTVCAAFELTLVPTEAKTEQALQTLRDQLQNIFQSFFPLYAPQASPWIMQWYAQDCRSLSALYQQIVDYTQPTAQGHAFTHSYQQLMSDYCQWLSQPNGIFNDDKVTGSRFYGSERRVKLVIYRQYHPKMQLPASCDAITDLNHIATRLTATLNSVGITITRLTGSQFRDWLLRWFNPKPAITNGDTEELLSLLPYPSSEQQPFGYDFAEQLFYHTPRSDQDRQLWWFDNLPHRYRSIQQLSRVPVIGQLTRERAQGQYHYSLLDKLPQGTVFVLTMTMIAQDSIQEHLERMENSARKNGSMAAQLTFEDIQHAKAAVEQQNYLFPVNMGVYLRGESLEDLHQKETQLDALLLQQGFHLLNPDYDLVALHSYLHQLPCCYRYDFDKKYLARSQYVFAKQIANLLPLYGRERGSGQPLLQFLNRGGETITLDPFHPADKDNNSHLLLLGATGSGKSATSTDLLIKLMGTYRPYLIIVDAGNSFHLLKEYFIEQGLSVHHVAVTLNELPVLNPFAETKAMLQQIKRTHSIKNQDRATEDSTGLNMIETRDYLGEMALSCQLMITGGEAKEQAQLTRQDRLLILDALVRAAQISQQQGSSQMIASDVVAILKQIAIELEQQQRESDKVTRLRQMADSLDFFTKDTLANQVFNRRGTSWPDADVILFEQGIFKDAGYETHNALAFMGLMSRTMAKAEARQFESRFTVFYGDEIHTLTKNPLTVTYLTQCAKMSRKMGLWLWLATQNVSDFPQDAKKMLSMIEFWLCLGSSEAEMKAIETFRPLSEEERLLFLSVRKAANKYVEGVLLSPRLNTLFRNVPPRLSLALAMTEQSEKATRKQLMDTYSISELEAAKRITQSLQQSS